MEEKENNVLGVEESKTPEEKPLTDEEVEESYETEEQEILEPTEEELNEAAKETLEEEAYAEKTEDKICHCYHDYRYCYFRIGLCLYHAPDTAEYRT